MKYVNDFKLFEEKINYAKLGKALANVVKQMKKCKDFEFTPFKYTSYDKKKVTAEDYLNFKYKNNKFVLQNPANEDDFFIHHWKSDENILHWKDTKKIKNEEIIAVLDKWIKKA